MESLLERKELLGRVEQIEKIQRKFRAKKYNFSFSMNVLSGHKENATKDEVISSFMYYFNSLNDFNFFDRNEELCNFYILGGDSGIFCEEIKYKFSRRLIMSMIVALLKNGEKDVILDKRTKSIFNYIRLKDGTNISWYTIGSDTKLTL